MRKLLLNQRKLIAKENLIMLFLAILAKMSAQKSEDRAQTFVHPGIPFTQYCQKIWLFAYSAFKNNSWINKLITV